MTCLKKIMIVDDEAGIREILTEALSGEGFDVTSAKDGSESLQYMRNDSYDLLITDINMPRLNGIELLKRMKTAGRKEKVVIMTGGPFDQLSSADDLPHIDFELKKPFRMEQFLTVISAVLGSKEKDSGLSGINEMGKEEERCYLN
jgi:DNA-binding NtrC family response regulator